MLGSINSIESFGAVDGPGIRVVVFLNGCSLRCKYCHNPEMWKLGELNFSPRELVNRIIRYKPYFRNNNGGVTFSGGEPLLQSKFLTETVKLLKEEDIHIALDTAGIYQEPIDELIQNVDLVIYDIKDIDSEHYESLTGGDIMKTWEFLKLLKKYNKKLWIRQVIVPGIHDNEEFLNKLSKYIKEHFDISNVEKIEFLPYHKLGSEKYTALGIANPYENLDPMDSFKCKALYDKFITIYEK